jgi:hypothetical protein
VLITRFYWLSLYVPLTTGGPAITQLFAKIDAAEALTAPGPFDTVVLFEAETALPDLTSAIERSSSTPFSSRTIRKRHFQGVISSSAFRAYLFIRKISRINK